MQNICNIKMFARGWFSGPVFVRVKPMKKQSQVSRGRPNSRPNRRYNRSVSIARPLRSVTGPLIKKHGFTEPQIFHQWAEIVGETMAGMSCPMRISRNRSSKAGYRSGATLTVRVAGAAALELEHSAPQILERINVFYGHKAVTRLRLEQGPLPLKSRKPEPFKRNLTATEEEELRRDVEKVSDPDLRKSLEALGRAIKSTTKG